MLQKIIAVVSTYCGMVSRSTNFKIVPLLTTGMPSKRIKIIIYKGTYYINISIYKSYSTQNLKPNLTKIWVKPKSNLICITV